MHKASVLNENVTAKMTGRLLNFGRFVIEEE